MATKPSRRMVSQERIDKSRNSTAGPNNSENGDLVSDAAEDQPVTSGDLRLSLTRRSPSTKYLDLLRMERLLEKLLLLDYTHVLQQNGSGITTILPRNYFLPDNPSAGTVKFQTFATLAVWMIGQLGIQLVKPEERDDPSMVVTSILESLRKLAVPVETTSHRLRSGSGSDVIAVLYELATSCLKQREEFRSPVFPEPVSSQDDIDEEGLDGVTDAEEFQSIPFYDWEQEEVADALADDDGMGPNTSLSATDIKAKQRSAEEWQLEADRVAPFFSRSERGADRLGWSDRIKKLDSCGKELDQHVDAVSKKLLNVSSEMGRSVEKLRNREKFISVNNKERIEKYRIASGKLTAAKAKYEAHNAEVEANAQKLADVTAEVDKLKRQLEAKSNSAGDRLAITNMRAAMKRMKDEIGVYNIKSAIAEMRLQELAEDLQNAEIEENLTNIETVGILPGIRD